MPNHKKLLILLLILLMVVGCAAGEVESTPLTPANTNWARPDTPTAAPTEEPSALPTPTFTEEPIIEFPDVLISVSQDRGRQSKCSDKLTNKVFLAKFPYENAEKILFEPDVNFNYPEWSPDGEWIGYVESIIGNVNENGEEMIGTDSVWIMRPDGTDRQRISDKFQNLAEKLSGWCRVWASIGGPIKWSPNSRFIIFNFVKKDHSIEYYLIDTDTKTTILIPFPSYASFYNTPNWINERQFAIMSDPILIFTIMENNEVQVNNIYFPAEMSSVQSPEWVKFEPSYHSEYLLKTINSELVGSFYLVSKNSRYLSLWKVNLETEEWEKIRELTDWWIPLIGDQLTAACGKFNTIYFINDQWEQIGKLSPSVNQFTGCSVRFVKNNVGQEFISILGDVGDDYGIWIYNQNEIPFLQMILSGDIVPLGNLYKYITDYSWRP